MINANKLACRASAMALAAAALTGCGYHTGDGTAVGNVTNLGRQGLLCRTYEGEMSLNNIRSARASSKGGSGSSTLDFNVQDPKIWAQLQQAQDDGTTVKVQWSRSIWNRLCKQAAEDIITKVTPVTSPLAAALGGNPITSRVDADLVGEVPSGIGARERVVLVCDPTCKATGPAPSK